MSEENNFETSDLCITEDAFEKFQAVSMCEEDDFITLSDIVPPQPTVPDLSSELNEIPYDNEVVLSSSQNEELQQVNNAGEINHNPYNVSETQYLDISESNDSNNHIPNTSGQGYSNEGIPRTFEQSNQNRKIRGRKKKSIQNDQGRQSSTVLDMNEFQIGGDDFPIEDEQAIQDSVLSTTVGKNGSESQNESLEESKLPRRTRREKVSNSSRYPHIQESSQSDAKLSKTPGKRRGRPKKVVAENQTISEADSTNADSTAMIQENVSYTESSGAEESSKNAPKRGRRGRPPKTVVQSNAEQYGTNSLTNNTLSMETECKLSQNNSTKTTRGGRTKRSKLSKPSNSTDDLQQLQECSTETSGTQPLEGCYQLVEPPPANDIKSTDGNSTQVNSRRKLGKHKNKNKVILEPSDGTSDQKMDEPPSNPDIMNVDNELDDDICLSKLKENLDVDNIIENLEDNIAADGQTSLIDSGESSSKRNSKMPVMSDFEYNIDKVINENCSEGQPNGEKVDESLLVEDTSKRPNRRKTKQNFKYDEDSDEDPFANVELSDDDEPRHRKKSSRYLSDDEYVPGKKRGKAAVTSSDSDSEDLNDDLDKFNTSKRRKNQSPKKGRKSNVEEDTADITPNQDTGDIEECLQPSFIQTEDDTLSMKPPAEAWATSNEFENFIAKKIQGGVKIKKVTSKQKSTSVVAPLEIPVIDPNEAKKAIEISTQTLSTPTTSTGVQTTVPYDMPMKTNIDLSSEQSEKACAFLNSVVKTTAELGELMKNKSEDFMKKKINTDSVTDTFKMDYCVRKSFLLFKLAKHNLMQMEEDLAKQYDEFLKSNGLSACREVPKHVAPKAKADSDSDCEIVDVKESAPTKSKNEKPKFNPKTVFLNKELSIKIAKKTPDDKKVEIKGRHTVWINDSIMVKKVKPTQSFLAQDSRNKKPPDTYVTEKMVSDFFEDYYRQKALAVCAPLINPAWTNVCREYACHYFVKCNDVEVSDTPRSSEINASILETDAGTANEAFNEISNMMTSCQNNPKSLFSLCAQVIINSLHSNNIDEVNQDLTCNLPDGKDENGPLTLFRLCVRSLSNGQLTDKPNVLPAQNVSMRENIISPTVLPLKTMCYRRIVELIPLTNPTTLKESKPADHDSYVSSEENDYWEGTMDECTSNEDVYQCKNIKPCIVLKKNGIKSLLSLCVEIIQSMTHRESNKFNDTIFVEEDHLKIQSPRSLKYLVYMGIIKMLYTHKDSVVCDLVEMHQSYRDAKDFTINCINTMSVEEFHNLEEHNDTQENLEDDDNDDYEHEHMIEFDENNEQHENYEEDEHNEVDENNEEDENYEEDEHNEVDENNEENENNDKDENNEEDEWVSQVQMQELRSCLTPTTATENDDVSNSVGLVEYDELNGNQESTVDSLLPPAQIKLEPLEDNPENVVDSSIVKAEPIHGLDEMTIIPESVITKSEISENANEPTNSETVSAYDVSTFEQFVRSNKMMMMMDGFDDDEIFSQSGLRIRRQHEPDYDAANDMNLGLLVPQTSEPLHIETAKGILMESSSDESKDGGTKKTTGKKRIDKKKTKQKKDPKTSNVKEISAAAKEKAHDTKTTNIKETPPVKEKAQNINELAVLTRRMRDKIRQEEKKIESSDSETENIPLSSRKDKNKSSSTKNIQMAESLKDDKHQDDIIQCNNVDSTEQILDGIEDNRNNQNPEKFTGFSAIDQNEMSSYQKYMKFVYDKILPEEENDTNSKEKKSMNVDEDNQDSNTLVINPDHPVELLECEPTMPIFDSEDTRKKAKKPNVSKKTEGKAKKEKKTVITDANKLEQKQALEESIEKSEPTFTAKSGWHCYSIDRNDTKLYQNVEIPLEKLPESFVDTYFAYQDIADKDKHDEEVDRLINLHTLNRGSKEAKSKGRQKGKVSSADVSEQNSENVSRVPSPTFSDHYDELTPSEDEGANVDDEVPPPVPLRATENTVAKNSLMDDHESDSDGGDKTIKTEPNDAEEPKKRKPGPKSKTRLEVKTKVVKDAVSKDGDSLMLTADKMMNKELNLLHAPIVLKEEVKDLPVKEPSPKELSTKEPSPKEGTRSRQRSSAKASLRDRIKTEDDSSSEEEKQWVSTKEKLLKRLCKKEDTSAEDAKRAKLVTEYIERRGDAPGKRRPCAAGGNRRSRRKKMLEEHRQLRVLSKELFGETSIDATAGKRSTAQGYFKGRRNIRKVIDKKSLARSTVLANMEEFERKRRLNSRQTQLRELLGCEEGVNVLVINDEVCLEYDFEEQRPVVTVHPFFTKVMKAHQYEGVKFMWDACFESLEKIERGGGGGGCILAHCMGLGKTLQVLALLHTVLTHPRVGMQRVLVCCPLSTVLNWVDEIHKWIGPVTDQIKVFELSKLKKTYERAYQLEDWYSGGGIFIIGYELFRSLTTLDPLIDDVRPTIINKIRTALLDPGPDIVICDEGHLLKNDCSVLAVAMSRVVTKRRIILTGTPMQNNLREYYCMVNFVKPNLLGTYSEYSNRFENPIMNGQHRDSREEDIKLMKARTHILHKVLEGCLQRQEASVLYPYLPKKHEYTVFIPLTKCQWDLYKHYLTNYTKKSKLSILKDFHILQKIWSHPQVLHNFQMKSKDDAKKRELKVEKVEDDLAQEDQEIIKPAETEAWWLEYLAEGQMLDSLEISNKFVAVFRILHECIALGDKVLIFSTSLFCLDALEYFLKAINAWSLGQEYFRLDGSVPAEVRQKWCREFNAENNVKTKLFLISTRAGCLGLNMTAANRVIILDTSWNPAHDIQSIFRVYRFGQKKDCYIYRLVAMGTMEQKIYERAVTKQAVACRVVDEQQIDRHYNMAELTELYGFDEFGASVAGGVAVGVNDVALLRVARDAAIHAVHEHDSLLRGSSEQGLPEHERAAAWMQFQQEHAHKQMQNDIETNNAILAIQKLRASQTPILKIKTEHGSVYQPALITPKEEPTGEPKPKTGRGRKSKTIVQCRIPILAGGSDAAGKISEEEMVRQITNILIKYNFTQNKSGPRQISELVAKVKRMVQTGEAVALGPGNDELTASIANVMLQRHGLPTAPPAPAAPEPPMPALTDVDIAPGPKRRGRKKKLLVETDVPEEPPPPPVEEPEERDGTGRRRRRAALAAEKQFDTTSQDSIIDIDDDWHAPSDTDSAPENPPQPPEQTIKSESLQEQKKVGKGRGRKRLVETNEEDCSIVLSDDDAPVECVQTTSNPVKKAKDMAPDTPQIATENEDRIALHPSLLTNQNFIKIVAHTYLSGNPMLDEDAATLAAQYSTFKALKELENTGNPIHSGPIYDIAIKVLGREVLRKLQLANPKSKEKSGDACAASKKMMMLLGDKAEPEAPPAPAPVKKARAGPKSRVTKPAEVKKEKEMPSLGVPATSQPPAVVPVGMVRRSAADASSDPPPLQPVSNESILPDDDDDVRLTASPPGPQPAQAPAKAKLKPIILKGVALKKEVPDPPPARTTAAIRVTSGRSAAVAAPPPARPVLPAAGKVYATICLDSDDDEPVLAPTPAPVPPPPASAPVTRRRRRNAAPGGDEPVPVSLTGPNSQPLPLPLGNPPRHAPTPPSPQLAQPTAYVPVGSDRHPVPMSLSGPDGRPVPMSLTGPDGRPVPMSLTGPDGRPVPMSLTGPDGRPVPMSLTGPDGRPVPMSLTGPDGRPVPMSLTGSDGRPVPMSLTGPDGRPVPMSMTRPDGRSVPNSMSSSDGRPVPMSLTGPDGRPVPMTLTGPDGRPVPMTLTGPDGRPVSMTRTGPNYQQIPMSLAGSAPQTISMSFADGTSIPISFAGGAQQMTFTSSGHTIPMSFVNGQPVAMSFPGGVQSIPTPIPMSVQQGAGGPVMVRLPAQSASAPTPNKVVHQTPANIVLVPASATGEKVLTRVPVSQVPHLLRQTQAAAPPPPAAQQAPAAQPAPPADTTSKTYCKPGDILRISKTGQLEILKRGTNEVQVIDDEPVQRQQTTPKPQAAYKPQAPTKVATSTAPEKNLPSEEPPRRRRIRTISSSSSSSASSRSGSPDPLSILKDVVHIQAPVRQKSQAQILNKTYTESAKSHKKLTTPSNDKSKDTDIYLQKLNSGQGSVTIKPAAKPSPSTSKSTSLNSTPSTSKSGQNTGKSTPSGRAAPGSSKPTQSTSKSVPSSSKPIPSTSKSVPSSSKPIPSTSKSVPSSSKPMPSTSKSVPSSSKPTPSASKHVQNANRPSQNVKKFVRESIDLTELDFNSSSKSKSSATKKDVPTNVATKAVAGITVVGTSKNIILDGKSKSLTNKSTINLSGQKNIQITNSKTVSPIGAAIPKVVDKKRPAPAEEPPPKKKKTEPMTLKDFDIDDIDDIIELD